MNEPEQAQAGPAALLNQSQERALAITLRLLEERIGTIRDLMDREDGGVLYLRPRPAFAPGEAARIDRLIAGIREVISSVAEAFVLPREERDPRGMIVALLAMSWQSIGEVDARGMHAYGDTDPRLSEVLDPHVRRLMDLVLELEAAVTDAGENGVPG
jgi:hypothetical protein